MHTHTSTDRSSGVGDRQSIMYSTTSAIKHDVTLNRNGTGGRAIKDRQ